jgi:hypothetical protein
MEKKYRIKINEFNNGEKRYIPQVGKPKLSLGKYVHLNYEWKNIIMDDLKTFQTTTSITYFYETEEKALTIVEGYKKYILEKDGQKANKTTYKYL